MEIDILRRPAPPVFSIVAPVRNDKAALPEFYRQVKAVMDRLGDSWELVLVDDGSCDQSAGTIALLCAQDCRVRGISLTRAFGAQAAAAAGLDAARGQAVVLASAVWPDAAAAIPGLAARWRSGFDVVGGVRRPPGNASRRAPGRLLQWLGRATPPGDDLQLLDRRVVDALKQMPERQRSLNAMVNWVGFRQADRAGDGAMQHAGNLPLNGAGRAALPLRLSGPIGLAAVLLSGLALAGLLVTGLTGAESAGLSQWAGLSVLCFLGGIQLISIGVVGEYLAQMRDEVKRRPLYLIDQRWGFTEQMKR